MTYWYKYHTKAIIQNNIYISPKKKYIHAKIALDENWWWKCRSGELTRENVHSEMNVFFYQRISFLAWLFEEKKSSYCRHSGVSIWVA
jgi:hypothetical protein